MAKTSLGLDENIEGALSYLLGWVTGLIFLLVEKDNKFVKFHAMQSLITFLVLTVIIWLFGWIPFFGWILSGLLGLLALIFWLILMIKAYQGEKFKLPVVGDIAEKNT
ncbi:MAG: DUF4870 domain-containing protein [Petrotogales bacterium]